MANPGREDGPDLAWGCGPSGVAMFEYPSDELKRVPFFSKLSPEQLQLFAGTTRMLEFRRNDVVIRSGEKPRGCYFILSGTVKLVASSGDGCEKVMDILSAGMTFGEALLFLDRPSPVAAQAIEKTRVLEIEREAVLTATEIRQHEVRRGLAHAGRTGGRGRVLDCGRERESEE